MIMLKIGQLWHIRHKMVKKAKAKIKEKETRGRKKRSFEPDLIERVMEIRVREQTPWKELPDIYMTLIPEDSKETKPDWTTLRNACINDPDWWFAVSRVTRTMRERIEQEFDKADMLSMLISMLTAKFGEWKRLHDKMIRSLAAEGMRDDDDERISTPEFTREDRDRMDDTGAQAMSYLFKMSDSMRQMPVDDNNLIAEIMNKGGSVVLTPGQQLPANAMEALDSMQAQVHQSNLDMLESINERHKREGAGHYRIIEPELNEDEDILSES